MRIIITEPEAGFRETQPYVAIRQRVGMEQIPAMLPPLIPEVFNWMKEEGVEIAGPPFFRYLSRDSDNNMVAEVGVPTRTKVAGKGRITSRELPPGHYASLIFTGNYSDLMQGHKVLDEWIKENKYQETGVLEAGEFAGCRVESYVSDPATEPDPEKWVTDLCVFVEKVH
jgi:effector-binding domain-containing protein